MPEETPTLAFKTHDIYAVMPDAKGQASLSLVGARMETNLGHPVELLFDDAQLTGAVLLVRPVGLSLEGVVRILSGFMT